MDEQKLVGLFGELLDSRLQQLEDRIDGKLQQLEERLTTKLEDGLNDVRGDLAAVTARVDLIKEAVDSLEEGMTDIKQALVYLQDKWVEHDKEIWRIKRKA